MERAAKAEILFQSKTSCRASMASEGLGSLTGTHLLPLTGLLPVRRSGPASACDATAELHQVFY